MTDSTPHPETHPQATMGDDSPRNPADDLAMIRQMMEAGKTRVAVNGIHFIIWGLVLMIAFISQYAAAVGYVPFTILGVWIPAFIIGVTAEYLFYSRFHKKDRESLPHIAHGSAWEAVGTTALIYFFVSFAAGTFEPRVISSINAATMGAAFLITSQVTGVRWLRLPAYGWWIMLAYIALIESYDTEMLLVMASACGLLLALPGFLMRRLRPVED